MMSSEFDDLWNTQDELEKDWAATAELAMDFLGMDVQFGNTTGEATDWDAALSTLQDKIDEARWRSLFPDAPDSGGSDGGPRPGDWTPPAAGDDWTLDDEELTQEEE